MTIEEARKIIKKNGQPVSKKRYAKVYSASEEKGCTTEKGEE